MYAFSLRNRRGFTLIELLISMALGLVISGTAVNLYLQSRLSYMQDEELARLQENARFSLNYLKREISLSGFFGGLADASNITPTAVTTDCAGGPNWALDISESFELLNNTDGSTALESINGTSWDCITATDLVAGTDVFSIKRTSDTPTLRDGDLQSDGEDLSQWYFRSFDYNQYSWSYLSAAIPSAEKTTGSTYDYWEIYTKIFYVREYAVTSGDGIPTLCVNALINSVMTNQCLVEGIQDVQLEVGIDTDGDGVVEQYKPLPTVADFDNARAIRIYLLARSINEVPGYTNAKTYRLGQKNIAAFNDGFIRKVFSTTVKLRNIRLG